MCSFLKISIQHTTFTLIDTKSNYPLEVYLTVSTASDTVLRQARSSIIGLWYNGQYVRLAVQCEQRGDCVGVDGSA
ncbi:Hypothetical protein PHPALM_18157 [Phytophthora palmivora]|uniref:Uncharacterized protein n=1 Tax=Phytophthora palmivora TaxID=4796 RepID=A0A2P4XKF9_9STRA|nr:Hypothetical protein PHPALM_18157 [Phytophthora palmivora]